VNDGSHDDTARVLAELKASAPEQIDVLTLEHNVGKAEAVRRGVLHVVSTRQPEFVGYWDADGSTPPAELDEMLALMIAHRSCRIVLGSRWKRLGSQVERQATRHVLGRIFATLASLSLSLPVYDSQCGAKLMRADTAAMLFAEPFVTRWLFDVELLARLKNMVGADAVAAGAAIESPLTSWREIKGSRLRWSHIVGVPFDLVKIHSRYSRTVFPLR
jgi:glycosyltransferase involved in cell wall biosynthesis